MRHFRYFETVRTVLARVTGVSKPLSLKEINSRINELLKTSIQSEGVINLFSDADIGFSLFDPQFLDDALEKPQAVKDVYENDVLVEMTRALSDMLRRNRTIDWQKKESARAGMRRMVKKLLKKYKYPPEGIEEAIATVIGQ